MTQRVEGTWVTHDGWYLPFSPKPLWRCLGLAPFLLTVHKTGHLIRNKKDLVCFCQVTQFAFAKLHRGVRVSFEC